MFFGKDGQFGVTLYDGGEPDYQTTFGIPGARNFRFAPGGESCLSRRAACYFRWRRSTGRRAAIGTSASTAEAELVDALVSGQHAAVLARRQSSDVWLYQGSSGGD